MNCEKIQERIDVMIFDTKTQIDQNILAHLNTCENCNSYYQEALKERDLISDINDLQPVLSDPDDLTDSIMQSIALDKEAAKSKFSNHNLVIRILAAAVIVLILTLGIEQYIVLNKILILESELGAQKQSSLANKNLIYQANMMDISLLTKTNEITFSIRKIKTLIRFNRLRQHNFTLYDFNRYMIKENLFKTDFPNQTNNDKD